MSTCTEGKGTVDTPVRLALRRRIRETGNDPEPGVFGEVVQLVCDKYSHLEANIVTAEADRKLTRYVIVCRKMKVDDDVIGPHDALRLMGEKSGSCKCWVYDTSTEEGSPHNFYERFDLGEVERMQATIGYNHKRVKPCD